jgi:mannose/fructose/N-acetylgalactosamine-specific phosphotransferase system component IIC
MLTAIPIAVLMEFVSKVAGTLLAVAGAFAGCLRAWAVLTRQSPDRIEWVTALGSACGAMLAILIVVIDLTWI